jgi:Large polyvalent protein associated domain 29
MAEKLYDIAEIAKRTKQQLKEKYPNLTFSVKSERFAGGSALSVYWMAGDIQPFTNPDEKHIDVNKFYIDRDDRLTQEAKTILEEVKRISNQWNWDRSDPMTDYFDVNYYFHLHVGRWDKPYEYKPSQKGSKPASTQQRSYPMGEVLQNCSGWIVSKKTLPDGRIVYNAKIKPDTPKNKGDWNQIKGEVYVQTGFKWGKFSSFDKWGQIERESEVLSELCKVLGKYYIQTQPQKEIPKEEPKPEIPQEKTSEKVKIYENGSFQKEVDGIEYASLYLKKVWGDKAYQHLIDNKQIQFDEQNNRLDYILQSFYYGEQSKVPANLGNELLFTLIYKGYKVRDSDKKVLIFKDKIGRETLEMFEKAENLILLDYFNNKEVGSVNYVINGQILSPRTLASVIDKIYYDTFEGEKREEESTKTEEPSQEMSKEKIEKAIAALKILAANGNEKAKSGIIALQYLLNK